MIRVGDPSFLNVTQALCEKQTLILVVIHTKAFPLILAFQTENQFVVYIH